ncbi:AraC family transcriptional regulator [Massilia sp. MP_M2]|uniref:GyrI-like domain-containing protein n=1 Tax=Massilia sp. MP_M2 TaxID=3071713 RepID=UPI00319E8B0E
MHISTITLPEMKLAGLPAVAPISAPETESPEIWKAFLAREGELGEHNGVRYGVTLRRDDGEQVECVAVEVADLDQLPPGMIGIRVPARRYALMTHRGPMLHAQASHATGTAAMEQLGMQADEEGIRLERYDRRYTPTVDDGARPDNAYDILVPLYG